MKGDREHFSFALYRKDAERFKKIRDEQEELTGRPCSPSTEVVFLLDRYDDLMKIEAAVQAENGKPKKTAKSK